MKGTAVILASQSLLTKVACERVLVDENGDDMAQLQSRSLKMGTRDLDSMVESLEVTKVEPGELLSNELAVAQLAEAVESASHELDDKTKKNLHKFKVFVMEVEKEIKDAHKEDQAALDDAHAAGYTACMKAFSKASLENAALKTQWIAKEGKHMACRKSQVGVAAAQQTVCGDLIAYQKVLKSSVVVPSTSEWLKKPTSECKSVAAPDTETFSKYYEKMILAKKSWELRSDGCSKASQAAAEKKADCEELQAGFETDFCGWRNAAYHNCYDVQQCQGDKVGEYAGEKAAALKRAALRRVHWQSARHIMCFLDVMLQTNNHTTLKGCKGDFDTSAFNLIIPDKKMEIEQCKLPGLASFPGSGGWSKRYEDAKCDAGKSQKCEKLPAHVLKATTSSEEQSFVRWGHSQCPSGTEKLYTGYAAGAHYNHRGSGANTLCLNPNPTFPPGNSNGNQNGALLYGTEYQNTGIGKNHHDKDAVCAVCVVRGATFTQWGRNICPEGHRQEYKGYVMSNHYTQHKGMFVCVDEERAFEVKDQEGNHDGNLWYTTEFEQGSLPGSVFKHNHEVSCAQCTALDYVSTYVRWGSRECPDGAKTFFTGFAAGSHYTHRGGGANTLCLHPVPTYPPGVNAGNQDGGLIYGTEYQNTGAVDKNHDKDAVCSLCAVGGHSHTQWGRNVCPDGYEQEYKGIVMADLYTHHKNTFVCVDEAREYTTKSSNSDHNGNLWYTAEYEQGSLPNNVFKHDHEVSCAQCTAVDRTSTYVRWGSKKCADHATTLYMGYAAGSHYTHRGSGHNALCLHPNPTYPPGTHGSSQNGALIYGTEYQNTGAIDKNHDKDAVCAMCAVVGVTFEQWGRDICPDGHRTEYKGVIMANHYTQQAGEFVCVDLERAFMTNGHEGDHNGNLWYTTEYEQGSLPNSVYRHDSEASCAVCSTMPME